MRQQWRWVDPSGQAVTCWYNTPRPILGRMSYRDATETQQGAQHVEIRYVEDPWHPCQCDCHAAIAAGRRVFHAFPCCGYAG